MKTFSEAVAATLMRKGRADEEETITVQLEEGQERYTELVQDIIDEEDTRGVVTCFIGMAKKERLCLADLITLAFAHGVMVGIEMEKPDA